MTSFAIIIKSVKVKWISLYLDSTYKDWKHCLEIFSKIKRLDIFLNSNFDVADIKGELPDYYEDSIFNWSRIKEYCTNYQENLSGQLVWYNKHCKIGGKSILNTHLLQIGIWTANDLYQDGVLIPFDIWQTRGARVQDYMAWRNIISCIPNAMKLHAHTNDHNEVKYVEWGGQFSRNIINSSEKDFKSLINKQEYNLLKQEDFKVKNKYNRIFGNISEDEWKKIYVLPHHTVKDNKIKEIQYKILFRYIGTNKLLYKIGKHDNPRCTFCEMFLETIEHISFECIDVRNLWIKFIDTWNLNYTDDLYLSCKDVVLGYDVFDAKSDNIKTINILIMYLKSYIFRCKISESQQIWRGFIKYVKRSFEICKYEDSISFLAEPLLVEE
mgnify:CR=1 FL=1